MHYVITEAARTWLRCAKYATPHHPPMAVEVREDQTYLQYDRIDLSRLGNGVRARLSWRGTVVAYTDLPMNERTGHACSISTVEGRLPVRVTGDHAAVPAAAKAEPLRPIPAPKGCLGWLRERWHLLTLRCGQRNLFLACAALNAGVYVGAMAGGLDMSIAWPLPLYAAMNVLGAVRTPGKRAKAAP